MYATLNCFFLFFLLRNVAGLIWKKTWTPATTTQCGSQFSTLRGKIAKQISATKWSKIISWISFIRVNKCRNYHRKSTFYYPNNALSYVSIAWDWVVYSREVWIQSGESSFLTCVFFFLLLVRVLRIARRKRRGERASTFIKRFDAAVLCVKADAELENPLFQKFMLKQHQKSNWKEVDRECVFQEVYKISDTLT
jgi:hypothetical protein